MYIELGIERVEHAGTTTMTGLRVDRAALGKEEKRIRVQGVKILWERPCLNGIGSDVAEWSSKKMAMLHFQ